MAKACARCYSTENITRDHVVPRSVLKQLLGVDDYADFCALARYVNIQPLCVECNNKKGSKSIDYREWDYHRIGLIILLKKWTVNGNCLHDLIQWEEDFDD